MNHNLSYLPMEFWITWNSCR